MSKKTNKNEVKKLEKKCKKLKQENEELKQEIKNLDKWIDDHANPRVKDSIAACEYTGCISQLFSVDRFLSWQDGSKFAEGVRLLQRPEMRPDVRRN